jgi:hypothetical protein
VPALIAASMAPSTTRTPTARRRSRISTTIPGRKLARLQAPPGQRTQQRTSGARTRRVRSGVTRRALTGRRRARRRARGNAQRAVHPSSRPRTHRLAISRALRPSALRLARRTRPPRPATRIPRTTSAVASAPSASNARLPPPVPRRTRKRTVPATSRPTAAPRGAAAPAPAAAAWVRAARFLPALTIRPHQRVAARGVRQP